MKPPFKPKLASKEDVRYIDDYFTKQMIEESPVTTAVSTGNTGGNWEGFSFARAMLEWVTSLINIIIGIIAQSLILIRI